MTPIAEVQPLGFLKAKVSHFYLTNCGVYHELSAKFSLLTSLYVLLVVVWIGHIWIYSGHPSADRIYGEI